MIIIIGAGIAGVTLARYLKENDVPFRIFDQQDGWKKQGFGLTLRADTTAQLLPLLEVEQSDFIPSVSVDRRLGKSNQFFASITDGRRIGAGAYKEDHAQRDFRTNRERLRSAIVGDVKIEYCHKMTSFERTKDGVKVYFDNDEIVEGSLLVAADGVRSPIRTTILPQCIPQDWAGIMINGTWRMSNKDFDERLRPSMGGSTVYPGFGDNYVLASTICDSDPDPENGYVEVSWGYSRRQKGENDPLFVSHSQLRFNKHEAPAALWDELAALPPLVDPFRAVFHDISDRKDPVIRHRMVSLLIPRDLLWQALAEHNVVFIGDSVHDWSNHAGTSANAAIQDALALGKHILAGSSMQDFYDERYPAWELGFATNTEATESIHLPAAEWQKKLTQQASDTNIKGGQQTNQQCHLLKRSRAEYTL